MKRIILTFLILFYKSIGFTQCINTYTVQTTDPAAINQITGSNSKVNEWNWTRDIYDDVYITQQPNGSNPVCYEIYAPWHNTQINSLNVRPLVLQRYNNVNTLDIYPIDGWELLTKNMGRVIIISDDGSSRVESVQNPSFSIYNRRTGHIKFFQYITSTNYQSPRVLKITLQYTKNQNSDLITGAMLNHRDSVQFVLPEFNPLVKQMGQSSYDGRPRPNEACNGTGFWLTAEFWAQFDPCACYPHYATKVEFMVEFIEDKIITMNIDGDITGSVVTTLYGNQIYLDNGFLQKSSFEGILGNTSAAIDGIVKGYKNADALNNFAMKLVTPKVVSGVTKPALFTGMAASKIAAKGAIFGPKGLMLAAGIGLVYSFVKANKVSKDDADGGMPMRYGTPKPLVYEKNFKVKLTANGNITSMPQVDNTSFFVPGSPGQPASFMSSKPIYNNVLGIISFTQLPKLQYVNWQIMNGIISSQYKLSDREIKYVVNPASGLQIESIQTQLVINLNKDKELPKISVASYMDYHPPFRGLFQFGSSTYEYCEGENDFEKQINASGLEIIQWPSSAKSYRELTYGTPFVDLPCVHDQTFLLNTSESSNLRVAIKFHIIFKVVNKFGANTQPEGELSNSNQEDELIEYIVTYPIEIENEPVENKTLRACYGYPFTEEFYCNEYTNIYDFIDPTYYRKIYFFKTVDPSPWSSIVNKQNLPVSLNFENTTLTGNQDFKALKSINIGNNVTISNGSNIHFKAGESIEVSDYFEANETTLMEIGLDPNSYIGFCDKSSYNSTPNLNDVCSNTSDYYVKSRSLAKRTDESIENLPIDDIEFIRNIKLYPNPVTDFSTIHFTVNEETTISIELYHINGSLISTLATDKYYPIGEFETILNLQGLNQGVYFLTFRDANKIKKLYKVIKQ